MRNRGLAGAALSLALLGPAAAQGQPLRNDRLGPGLAQNGALASVLLVEPIVDRTVNRLPEGALYWRVETFPSIAAASAAAGPFGLAAEAWGQAWLVTLGPRGARSPGGARRAEVGPVPIPKASRWLLRVNRAGGPIGAKTPVHTHPGSEAFYVVKGRLVQHTAHGRAQLDAGAAMNGHEPGMVMQLESAGPGPLEQLVMFVVDAERPFSTPAHFEP